MSTRSSLQNLGPTDRNNNNYESSHNKGAVNNFRSRDRNNNNFNLGLNNNCCYGISSNIMVDATNLGVAKQWCSLMHLPIQSAAKLDSGPESHTVTTSNNDYNNNYNLMHNLGYTTINDLSRLCFTRSFPNNHFYTHFTGYNNFFHNSSATTGRQHNFLHYSVTLYCDFFLGGGCSEYVKLSLANHGTFQLQLTRILSNNHCNHHNNLTYNYIICNCYICYITGYNNFFYMTTATTCRRHQFPHYSVTLYCDIVLGGFCSMNFKTSFANHGSFQFAEKMLLTNCQQILSPHPCFPLRPRMLSNIFLNHDTFNYNCHTCYITGYNNSFYKTTTTTCSWHYFLHYSVTLYCDIVPGGFCSMHVKTSLANHGSLQFFEKTLRNDCQQMPSSQPCLLRLRIPSNNFLTCNHNKNNTGWKLHNNHDYFRSYSKSKVNNINKLDYGLKTNNCYSMTLFLTNQLIYYNNLNWSHYNNNDCRHHNHHKNLHAVPKNNKNANNRRKNFRNLSNKEMHAKNGNILRRQLPKRRSLVFGWWNCQKGFINQGKKLELESFLMENKVDVFGVQEVEIYKTTYFYSDLYRIQGYKHIFPISLEKHGRGRCVVYFKEGLQELITERLDLMSPTQPIIWLQLGSRNGPLLAFYYREWTGLDGVNSLEAQKTRLREVLVKVSKAMEGNNEVYLMGDLNVDAKAVMDLSSADPLAKMINDTMIEEGLNQLITKTTRSQIVNNVCKESSIDHLYTNVPENTMAIKINHTASSDHAMITFKRRRKVVIPRKKITIRSFKNFNETDFLKELGRIDWKSMPDNNVDEATEFLTSSILNVLDQHAPVITFTPSSNYNPVISESTKVMMKKRDLVHEKAKQTGNAEHVKEYKQLRNQVVGQINRDKKLAVESEMEKGSSAWKALNIMRSKSKSTHGPPIKLILEGKEVKDTARMASAMNEFFTEKIKKLQDEIGMKEPAYDPVEHLKANLPDNIETLNWSLTSPLEVKETIEHLQNSSSAGFDGISNWILK